MALLYEEIMRVPGLEGTWQQRLNTYGQRFFGGGYTGSYDQNIQLYNKIQAGDWGATPAPAAPTNPAQVTPFLNDQQQQEFINQNQLADPLADPEVTEAENLANNALNQVQNPTTQLPTAPNFEQVYNDLRESYGVDVLEGDLNNLKAAEQEVYARLRIRTNNEKGQRVGMGVISGRVSEIEQQEREELDFIQRQINTRTNQVQTAYNAINTIVNFKKMDFDTALELYNTEFNKNVKMYEILKDNYRDIRDYKTREKERKEDLAKANLQIYADLITSGSLQWNSMDRETQLQISRLELQSGLGIGFISKLDIPLSARIREIGTRTDAAGMKWADTIIINKDGSYTTKSVQLGIDGEFVAAQQARYASQAASQASAQAKAKADQQKAFNDDMDKFQKEIRDNPQSWGSIFDTVKARYGLNNEDTDKFLGVPDSWIRSGRPGWEWANQTYG